MRQMDRLHRPVMVKEVMEYINLIPGGCYGDLTLGEGGHAEMFLEAPIEVLYSIDRDLDAISRYREVGLRRADPRLKLIHGNNSRLKELTPGVEFDGLLVDLGVSTRQLLESPRGFSFQRSGPLDMRMDPTSTHTLTSLLSVLSASDLSQKLEEYGELKHSKKLAERILREFQAQKLKDTLDLGALMGGRTGRAHPATQLFMALRMMVNDELGEITRGITEWVSSLKPGGRLVILTFHSVEDRCVKRELLRLQGRCQCEIHPCACSKVKQVHAINKKAIAATYEESRQNPRARSAKLRCVEKNLGPS